MAKRALISVSDKTGITVFAEELAALGIELISTGGTKRALEEAGLNVTGIEEVTGFPEIMDGRVKTLHPLIHGGLLGKRDEPAHTDAMKAQKIAPIDIVAVNLYPFQQTLEDPEKTFDDAVENIDIGGPSMIRSAAKNHQDVTVLVDAADYPDVLSELKETGGSPSLMTKRKLAAKAFRHTAAYDALIAEYLTTSVGEESPEKLTLTYNLKQSLRYGENPHQNAAFYERPLGNPASLAKAEQLHGKELSYNNINDADAAMAVVRDFKEPAVAAVKHMNPCGVGMGASVYDAWTKAYEADSTSIFGGIIASNREIDGETAEKMSEIFLEIVIAPGFSAEALAVLTQKKNIRLLKIDLPNHQTSERRVTTVAGGALTQETDTISYEDVEATIPTARKPSDRELEQMKLAWKVVKHVKSNAITLAKDDMTIGVGAGQMNRVGAAKIALEHAGEKADGSVMASDAFFPMADTVEEAARAGVRAIIQPGGSKRDQESIDKADEYGIAMVMTGVRHFKH
ncbi:bifunctional phosphoribosylaminoimidazolecarboxamide formyltransferase/IMP cyclohydrolase [Salisediminibacterium halotolerans]|uniref:bifunctional phosphoribosylaminoimidazolecarboxamide formyltransferase/IMP cyclohydrolase n=1 Tax=Salisediminibacterium halotolerans TaxID=517425 RepID=UPI000EB2BAC1|nr:bifunctional phosphoribosylaminoimidazolecarboxamide formyltransferase/IMP cyclohydrolase [Salisediminibacterium halotolerans]RLJ71768.1 phosphoribosylaminoimidazolecarboxamide formyltransferase/IMP cyclohydrolase [Actinophytocola xinjiangensis]RPE86918.1 phosphoribosylaminoimidazolecarboxamide formyltransferase/IMP cyclohydrolase [Salisediminibacterium halotolerans]TWG32981.1 phosphoribosylaminoimidazolecarboxamide formyltransferase/IMP cyclohydrolase [Salisediminibacterium halotolerans]GEL